MIDSEAKTLDDDTKRLLREVANVAGKLGGGEVREMPPYYRDILAIYDRCKSMFGAVWLLADRGFGQEGVGLGRSLFTESLMLAELAEADERRRAQLVTGWTLAALDDFIGVLHEAESRGDDATAALSALTSARKRLEASAQRENVSTKRWRPTEKALARKHNMDGYLDFRVAHHFVHGTTLAGSQRYTERDDVFYIGGPAARGGWSVPAALFAAQSLLYACRATSSILELNEPAEVGELLERLDAVAESMRT